MSISERDAAAPGAAALSIVRARDGSSSALGVLFEHYRAYLLHLARAELDDALLPKVAHSDLVQETFLQAVYGFPRFRGETEEELRAWLRQILHHNVRDAVKHYQVSQKRCVRREVSLDAPGLAAASVAALAAREPTPSARTRVAEESAQMLLALCRLDDVDRRVIELRSLEGLSFEEVGKALERSAEAVRKLWSRAIEKLAEKLATP